MIRLRQTEAQELLARLQQYPADAWDYEPSRQSIRAQTKGGSVVEVLFKSWPGWGDDDYGKVYEQYHLTIGGVAIGALDMNGRELDIWKAVNLKDLYQATINDGAIRRKLDEEQKRRVQLKEEAESRRQKESRELLDQI